MCSGPWGSWPGFRVGLILYYKPVGWVGELCKEISPERLEKQNLAGLPPGSGTFKPIS